MGAGEEVDESTGYDCVVFDDDDDDGDVDRDIDTDDVMTTIITLRLRICNVVER